MRVALFCLYNTAPGVVVVVKIKMAGFLPAIRNVFLVEQNSVVLHFGGAP